MMKNRSRVLFCTVGATPQVATETVWQLMKQTPPWVPQEIHVVTTAFKLDFVRESLQGRDGPLGQLMGGAPPVRIHVPRDGADDAWSCDAEDNGPVPAGLLSDIRDDNDAARMGNLILRVLARITADPETELHVSLAGGRKTMSAQALVAMSLVGRIWDKASHVLVAPAGYEGHPRFWHPGQGGKINLKGELHCNPPPPPTLDPANATVILVPVPTPLMRNRVVRNANLADLDLFDLMRKTNLAVALEEEPCVTLHVADNRISANGVTVDLTPKHFAVYRLLATARKENWPGAGPGGIGNGHAGWLTYQQIACATVGGTDYPVRALMKEFIEAAEANAGLFTDDDNSATTRWKNSIGTRDALARVENVETNMAQDISRLIRRVLPDEVGPDAAEKLAPQRDSERNAARFGLSIPPQGIVIT